MIRKKTTRELAVAAYKRAYCERRAAEERERQASAKAFPAGSEITYRHGDHLLIAHVVSVNPYFASVEVRGATGAVYWLDASRITSVD